MRTSVHLRTLTAFSAWMLLGLCHGPAWAGEADCGPLKLPGQYGPWDYRQDKDRLPVVLNAHFTPQVENLVKELNGSFGQDIDFTLRAIPNNPRALQSMVRLAEREKTDRPKGTRWNVECYFDRAIRFRPDDGDVRTVYAVFLMKRGRMADAGKQLEAVDANGSNTPNTDYNMGLIYLSLKKYEEALRSAHRAYLAGFALPGLRNKLEAVGKWKPLPVQAQAAPEGAVPADAPEKAGAAGNPPAAIAGKEASPAGGTKPDAAPPPPAVSAPSSGSAESRGGR